MSSNAHAPDPLSPRLIGVGLAMAGLMTLMVSAAPNWQSVGIALVCLFAFAVSLLIPRPRSAPAESRLAVPTAASAETEPPSDDPVSKPGTGKDARPPPSKPVESHRAIRATVLTSRVSRDP